VQWATLQVLTMRWGRFVTGQEEAIDLERLDIVQRAGELRVPILLLHSNDDGYIPATASRALAAVRPDIVTYEEFSVARHTRLWNYDAPRWTQAIKRWLDSLRA
jgi:alpha-beta hydrolase superfamily lysophospholipase